MEVAKSDKDARCASFICDAGKTPGWAGATPLFGLAAAQNVFGVAPAQSCMPAFEKTQNRGKHMPDVAKTVEQLSDLDALEE